MSSSPANRIRPLNVGNVVTAALKLYGANRNQYFQLAVKAYLWILVPVYGWAKYGMLSALIARLAFKTLVGEPESVEQGHRELQPRLWPFLEVGFLVFLILFGIYIGLCLGGVLVGALLGGILFAVLSVISSPTIASALGITVGVLVLLVILLLGMTWFISRWILAEVPLAVEADLTSGESIGRSWRLTQMSAMRICLIVTVAFLVTLPLLLITNYLPQIPLYQIDPASPVYWLVYLLSIITSFLGGMITLPFWQCLKGVLYYDMCSRREGLDLTLRDRAG